MFSKKKQEKAVIPKESELEINILENFSDICVRKCVFGNHIENDLIDSEKKCLAKCIDRSYDYLRITERAKI